MLEMISQDELTQLLEQQQGVHLSLFMPLEQEPDKRQVNRIRLKNLIKQAQKELADLPDAGEEQLLQPANDLLNSGHFVTEDSRGLAIFLTPGFHRIYHLPLPLDELVVVGKRFHIKPLLPLLGGNGRFYLLTLSQNQVQLWRGTRFSLEQLETPALPASMAEALVLEDPERTLQFHTSTGHGEDRSAAFHGHDATKEKKGAILRYCREVNEAVQGQLASENAPLLLASAAYLLPIYQEANTYPQLLTEGIHGNPENLGVHELHEQAWAIVQPHVEQARIAAANRYREFTGTQKSSQSVTEVVPAAAYGRVKTLFVPIGVQKWGRFDPASGEVHIGQTDGLDSEDLLDLAAAKTLLQGGTVFAVQPEDMPDKTQLAAIFRY